MTFEPDSERRVYEGRLLEGVARGDPSPAADEELELVRWPLGEVAGRLAEIEDAKTLAGLLLFLRFREGQADSMRTGP